MDHKCRFLRFWRYITRNSHGKVKFFPQVEKTWCHEAISVIKKCIEEHFCIQKCMFEAMKVGTFFLISFFQHWNIWELKYSLLIKLKTGKFMTTDDASQKSHLFRSIESNLYFATFYKRSCCCYHHYCFCCCWAPFSQNTQTYRTDLFSPSMNDSMTT